MSGIPADLQAFLAEYRDSRAYRRGLALTWVLQGYAYATIGDLLDVTPGFISQVKTADETEGIDGLRLNYQGTRPYWTEEQRHATVSWLKTQQSWSVEQLRAYLETTYDVVYKSTHSY